ncbi:MAG: hypothetical protein J1G02_05450 [Clostridiales bacterium]|nr:hypothetical protein [Clostridiales bacterium]
MFKREWTVFTILSVCTVAITVFAIIYKYDGARVEWLTYVAVVAIIATLAFLVYLLYINAKQKFDRLLSREQFVANKEYMWGNYKLLIDFESQRLANNYLSTRAIIPFSDVAGYRIETYHKNDDVELSDEHVFLSLVITLKKAGFEFEYQYLPVFEIKVNTEDVNDIKEVTSELVAKYPELSDVLALQEDLSTILQTNIAHGIRSNIHTN